jgi:hypothetical protein
MKPDKEVSKSYSELLEAFSMEGCPICYRNYQNIKAYFSNILYECVTDLSIRRSIRASLGYCRNHSVQYIHYIESSFNRFGASIITEDVVNETIKRINKLKSLTLKELNKININTSECPACIYERNYVDIYYVDIVKNFNNEEFIQKFKNSDGFCLKHFLGLIKITRNLEIRNKISENEIEKLIKINKDLNNFVKKHSGQNNDKISIEEADSFKKAIQKITGN